MATPPVVLVINPGSTSTRTALYQGEAVLADQELTCSAELLAAGPRVVDQLAWRTAQVEAFLRQHGRSVAECQAVAARGGPLRPVPGGIYRVNEAMLADARGEEFIAHASRLACLMGYDLCRGTEVPCFVVDPVSTDEFDELSRISGVKELPRLAMTHALNMKRAARRFAGQVGVAYEKLNLITAHLGGGTSLAVHRGGRMVDSVDANGDGPFSPERSGGLRTDSLVRFALAGGKPAEAVLAGLTRRSGLISHLGTADSKAVEERVKAGDAEARLVYEAMAYAVARHICGLAAAVNGRVDGVILTGGLARSEMITDWIRERIAFLGPVAVYPGENEMAALAEGAARALAGEEVIREYPTGNPESRDLI